MDFNGGVISANRSTMQLVIDTQGGARAPGAAQRSTGRMHLVHRNLDSKVAVRVFAGNVSDDVIGQSLYMAGTPMRVPNSAFGESGEYNFSAVNLRRCPPPFSVCESPS